MTRQAQQVSAILAARPSEGVRSWLDQLEAVLSAEAALEPTAVGDLVARARPRWGVSSPDDAAAYVAFWATLASRRDEPALRAAFADVLYLLGPRTRAREALEVFLVAAHRDPDVFIEYAGDFGDLAAELEATKEFDLAKIAFYARRVDQGEMETSELQDAVRDMLQAHPDDAALRDQLRAIAHRSRAG